MDITGEIGAHLITRESSIVKSRSFDNTLLQPGEKKIFTYDDVSRNRKTSQYVVENRAETDKTEKYILINFNTKLLRDVNWILLFFLFILSSGLYRILYLKNINYVAMV